MTGFLGIGVCNISETYFVWTFALCKPHAEVIFSDVARPIGGGRAVQLPD